MCARTKVWGLATCLVTIGLQALCAQEGSKAATDPNLTERQAKLGQIRQSHDRQRAIFHNMRFKSNSVTRSDHDRGGLVRRTSEEMEIDKEGRYLFRTETIIPAGAEGNHETHRFVTERSFDGLRYWLWHIEPNSDHVETATGTQAQRIYITIEHLMPHLFWPDFQKALSDSSDPIFMELPTGLCVLVVSRQAFHDSYRVVFDPRQEFMVTRLEFLDEAGRVAHQYRMEYQQTSEGFWYPSHGLDGADEMDITDVHLNVADFRCQIAIPKGTQVWDYSEDPGCPDVYRYGQGWRTLDQIIQGQGWFVAGKAVDEKGQPVSHVPVGICYCRMQGPDAGPFLELTSQEHLVWSRTDSQGQFVLEVPLQGEYGLLFRPKDLAPAIVYGVPVGTRDLKVTLPQGGTVNGRVVCPDGDTKAPVAKAVVTVRQVNGGDLTFLGPGQDRMTTADDEGRFQFAHLSTHMRVGRSKPGQVLREWELQSGDASQTVVFPDRNGVKEVELVMKPGR